MSRRSFASGGFAATLWLGSAASLGAQVDRTRPPTPGQIRSYRFPAVERATLPNGLEIQVIDRPGLPIASLWLVVPAGAEAEPAEQAGLAQLAARLLSEGTTSRSAAEIAEALESLGGTISTSAGFDAAFVNVTVLSRNLGPAMEIMADVTLNPSFPEREVERLKNQRLAEIQRQRAQPEGLAAEMFARLVFDSTSTYRRPAGGTPQTVRALARDALAGFHARAYRPNGSALIVVGDARLASVRALAQRGFGPWPRGEAARASPASRPGGNGGKIHLFDRPGAVQSAIAVGGPAIGRNHPDYVPLQVFNTVFGGAFGSRINLNLREARGYTYGAFSFFFAPRLAGNFTAQTSVRTPTTDSSVAELLREFRRIRDEAVPEDELNAAKQNLIGRFPADFLTNQALATALANRIIYGLPADYYDTYRDRVAAVDAAAVQALARRYLDFASFVWVVVGDAGQVEAPLRQLGAVPVEVYDLEGRRVR